MLKKLFLITMVALLGLFQTTHSSWAARDNKKSSQTQKNQTPHENNFSLLMHGAYDLGITYTDCDGVRHENEETIRARSTINVCAKVGTAVSVSALHVPYVGHPMAIPMYKDGTGNGDLSIEVPEKGITMDCGRTALNARCDWSNHYKPQ